MTQLEKALYTLALLPFGIVWAGLVLLLLWSWFAVPLGAPALDLALATGVLVLVRFLVLTERDGKQNGEDRWAWLQERLTRLFGVPALFLATGWLIQLFL